MNPDSKRIAVLFLWGVLAACEPIWSTPEGHARDFMEALVMTPTEVQKMQELAHLPVTQDPEGLIGDVAGRVGVDFLRAQRTQGVSMKFVRAETRKLSDARRLVGVNVSYLQPGTPMTGEVRFRVLLEKNDQGDWRIARVSGEN